MSSRSFKVLGCNPLKGEARAAHLAGLSADCFDGVPVTIKGDCLELVNQVQDRDRIPDWEIFGEVDTIRSLLDIHHEWSFVWTTMEDNAAAHALAHWCVIQNCSGIIRLDSMPSVVMDDGYSATLSMPLQ